MNMETDFLHTIAERIRVNKPLDEPRHSIGTVFLDRDPVIITGPATHSILFMAYMDMINTDRSKRGEDALTVEEIDRIAGCLVDVIIRGGIIYLRPGCRPELIFEADEFLQDIGIPPENVSFLAHDQCVREMIRRRGISWRIHDDPTNPASMTSLIRESRVVIDSQVTYYYDAVGGTRYLTCQEFDRLSSLGPEEIVRCLEEIMTFSGKINKLGNLEIGFFKADHSVLSHESFSRVMSTCINPERACAFHKRLCRSFARAVPVQFRTDAIDNPAWRAEMFRYVTGRAGADARDEEMLSPEFHYQVKWLPGVILRNGAMEPDPVYLRPGVPGENNSQDMRVLQIICCYRADHPDLEYINVGRVESSLSTTRKSMPGRRMVYAVVFGERGKPGEQVHYLRMMKRDVCHHLDTGMDLDAANEAAAGYYRMIGPRQAACRALGMNIKPLNARNIVEEYRGSNAQYRGMVIPATFFIREFIHGVATDKIAGHCFEDAVFTRSFFFLMGRAAASNMLAGRVFEGTVLFDDGDEVLVSKEGIVTEIVTSDHTAAMADATSPLAGFAEQYAAVVNRRIGLIDDAPGAAKVFVDSLVASLSEIQQSYRHNRGYYLDIISNSVDESIYRKFAPTWRQALARLEATDPVLVGDSVMACIDL